MNLHTDSRQGLNGPVGHQTKRAGVDFVSAAALSTCSGLKTNGNHRVNPGEILFLS